MHQCSPVKAREGHDILLCQSPPYSFKAGSLTEPGAELCWWSAAPVTLLPPSLKALNWQARVSYPSLYSEPRSPLSSFSSRGWFLKMKMKGWLEDMKDYLISSSADQVWSRKNQRVCMWYTGPGNLGIFWGHPFTPPNIWPTISWYGGVFLCLCIL